MIASPASAVAAPLPVVLTSCCLRGRSHHRRLRSGAAPLRRLGRRRVWGGACEAVAVRARGLGAWACVHACRSSVHAAAAGRACPPCVSTVGTRGGAAVCVSLVCCAVCGGRPARCAQPRGDGRAVPESTTTTGHWLSADQARDTKMTVTGQSHSKPTLVHDDAPHARARAPRHRAAQLRLAPAAPAMSASPKRCPGCGARVSRARGHGGGHHVQPGSGSAGGCGCGAH